MWAYISCVGKTAESIVSCLWALSERGIAPQLIVLLHHRETRGVAERVKEMAKALLEEVETKLECCGECSLAEVRDYGRKILKELKEEEYRLVVDVTSGRKIMSIGLFDAAIEAKADMIVYLELKDDRFLKFLYPLIPKPLIELVVLRSNEEN